MKEKNEELPEKFWREYEEADMLEREKKLKAIVENIAKIIEIKDEKLKAHALKLSLKSYFDDILDYKNQSN